MKINNCNTIIFKKNYNYNNNNSTCSNINNNNINDNKNDQICSQLATFTFTTSVTQKKRFLNHSLKNLLDFFNYYLKPKVCFDCCN